MAIPVRHEIEFTNSQGYLHILRILDTEWVASKSDITLNGEAFTINYNGDADGRDRFKSIISSQCTFSFSYTGQDSTINNLISDLIQYQEDRFYIEIGRATDASIPIIWRGKIVQDLIKYDDLPKSRFVEVTASCGLNSLKAVSVESIVTGLVNYNFVDLFTKILKEALPTDFWGTSDAFLRTVAEWYEVQQIGTTIDPLRHSRFNLNGVLGELNNDNVVEYLNCYEALEIMLKAWGARIFMADGKWNIIQVAQYKQDSFRENLYTFGYNSVLDDPDDDDAAGATILAENQNVTAAVVPDECITGGEYSFLPALKEVRASYDYAGINAITKGFVPFINLDISGKKTVATVSQFGNVLLEITLSTRILLFDYNPSFTSTVPPIAFNYNVVYTIELGGYYLDGANGSASWSASPATYTQKVQLFDDSLSVKGSDIDSIVINIPATTGNFEISLASVALTLPGGFVVGTVDPEVLTGVQLNYVTDQDEGTTTFIATNTDNDKSSVIADLGEIKLGDLPNSAEKYKLEVWTGTEWLESEEWQFGFSGTKYLFGEMLVLDYLRGQKQPILKYSGQLITNCSFFNSISRDSKTWMFLNGTYDGRYGIWDAEWVETAYVSTGITIDKPLELEPFIAGGPQGELDLKVFTEINDLVGLGQITSAIDVGDTVTSITIGTLPVDIPQGFKITVVNPTTKLTQTFTTSADAAAGSSVTVSVTSATATAFLPVNSQVLFTNADALTNANALSVSNVLTTKMQALEKSADFTIDANYNMSVVRCYGTCANVTLGTPIDGLYTELYNDTSETITINDVDNGDTTFNANDLVMVRGVKNVGWVTRIL